VSATPRPLFGWQLSGSRALDASLLAGPAAMGLALAHAPGLWVFVFAASGLVPLEVFSNSLRASRCFY